MSPLRPLPPLDTAPLFPRVHADLVALLRSLEPEDWHRPTVAGAWRVRDVAAHLLDGVLRKLAAHRDGHLLAPDGPVDGYDDVVALIQRLNAGGVAYGERLSPRLLTDLLEVSGRWMSDFVAALDPDAPALFAVAWAGEAESDNRLDTAREYTEWWHHQMQIRLAVGERARPAHLLAREYLTPLIETALHALPHAWRATDAQDGACVVLRVTGAEPPTDPDAEAPLAWTLLRADGRWWLRGGEAADPAASAEAGADAWWRLLFNALPTDDARAAFATRGDERLLAPLWRARSVMV